MTNRCKNRGGGKTNKNGKKYRKNTRKNKTRIIKKMSGGEFITDDDVMYKDDLVCILQPGIKKGILIWSHYTQPTSMDSLCTAGLKTGKQLQAEGIDFGRIVYHPYIFFRAPYYSRDITYDTVDTEISSLFGEVQNVIEPRVFIRVDPDRTFVFSSEIRAKYYSKHRYNSKEYIDDMTNQLQKSKKPLTEYLKIIKTNSAIKTTDNEQAMYNLYTSEKRNFPKASTIPYPWDINPIDRHSEILVSIPHLTPEYYVLCTSDESTIPHKGF